MQELSESGDDSIFASVKYLYDFVFPDTDETLVDFDNLYNLSLDYNTDDELDVFNVLQKKKRASLTPVAVVEKKMACKVIVIGPSGAGKSTFIRQYIERKFPDDLPATVGS